MAKKAESTRGFVCTGNVKCNGKDYSDGSPIELTHAQWLELGPAGAGVVAHPDDYKPVELPAAALSGQRLVDKIAGALAQLDPEDDFTRSGKPIVASVEAALGFRIGAADLDLAFAQAAERDPDLFGGPTAPAEEGAEGAGSEAA
jgi:hypothetical protein